MSNTVQTIQASTNNTFGLMATPAVPCVLADQDHHKARVTFDPKQTSENAAKAVVLLKAGDARRQQLHTDSTDEPTPCHLYPGLCTVIDGEEGDMVDENGRHYDHGSDAISVPGLEVEGDPEIWAEFTHVSAGTPPHIGLMGFDLTPDQARVKAREMRQFADKLDALADQVATARALHDVRTVRETADPVFARILTIVETAIVRDGADPTEVFDHVLELMDQARAAA